MAGNTDNKIMKTLVAVHKILGIYDDCLDSDSLALERLNSKSLKISENRFSKIIIMLSEAFPEGGGFSSRFALRRRFRDCGLETS